MNATKPRSIGSMSMEDLKATLAEAANDPAENRLATTIQSEIAERIAYCPNCFNVALPPFDGTPCWCCGIARPLAELED